MTSTTAADNQRERQLIEKLEFRIASADTAEKLQGILLKFLPALLLKLGSEDVQNRNLTIKVCQYINQRLKIDDSIQLPVSNLSKAYTESQNAFVKQFSLLFIQQGLRRLSSGDAISTLPAVLQSVSDSPDQSGNKMFPVAIDFLLKTLSHWKPPEHSTAEDLKLKSEFGLAEAQVDTIVGSINTYLLFDPKASQSFVREEMRPIFETHFRSRTMVVPNLASLLFTSIFTDEQRLIPAIILSVDANSMANSKADTMFKQCSFDLEASKVVDTIFQLYEVARPKLQTKILNMLSRSKESTLRTSRIVNIIQKQLSEPTSNLETSKLRGAMFTYLVWAIRINSEIQQVAEQIRDSLKEFIEVQGWPVPTDMSSIDVDLRARAYESIGLLSGSTVSLKTADSINANETSTFFNLVAWLFTSLRCDTTRDVRHSIEESLSRLMVGSNRNDALDLSQLKTYLLWNTIAEEGDTDPVYHLQTRNTVQYPAVRFANKIFTFQDVDARIINLIALTSNRREVVEEGSRGLDPTWHAANSRIGETGRDSEIIMPNFSDFAGKLFGDYAESPQFSALLSKPSAIAGATVFLRNLLAENAWKGSTFDISKEVDWTNKIDATLDNETEARESFHKAILEQSESHVLSLLSYCYTGMAAGSADCANIGLQLTSSASNSLLRRLSDKQLLDLEVASRLMSVRNSACRIIGIIISLTDVWVTSVTSALSTCTLWKKAAGLELAGIETLLLKSAYTLSRAAIRGAHTSKISEVAQPMWQLCNQILESSSDKGLKHVALLTMGQMTLCINDHTFEEVEKTTQSMLAEAKKENAAAVTALGRVLFQVWLTLQEDERKLLLSRLYELHEIRKAEFHFALGEAMAVGALGFSSNSTLTEWDIDGERPSRTNADLYERLLDDILENSKNTKPALRKANGIWLLSLVQFCSDSELVKPRLREIQVAFSRLLTDRDEIVQETGSRGLGIVYEKGDQNLRDDLVRDLVQSFTGNTAKTAGTVTEETQLFEPGALPTENGQSVTTYKDIVSLAQEMGDPSLVYRFMNLASNNAIWTSRAAFGRFGLSGVLSDSTYLKENKKFYPKLFRYRFDPNPNVQRSMNDIWKALVRDTNSTIDEHFDLIIEDLLQSIVYGKEWRAREASCAAIADLVQGREVEKYGKYLDRIWNVAFKVLDDVKESVRVAAMKLCRTLTNMLLRNLEVGEGTTKRATTMLKHAVPFLLEQMENGGAKEVQQYAIVTLLDIVKKGPPRSLQQYAPLILEKLVNSLSSLEHESINYLHLNAEKYGLTAEKLDNMRVSSVGASPVTEAIERCLESLTTTLPPVVESEVEAVSEKPVKPFDDAMKRLENSYKVTIGLPSRVGLSRVMITLVVRYSSVFRPFADRFVRLTRKSVIDRNATISQSFTTALAYLLRLASEKEVRQTNAYAQRLYFESQDVSHRSVAGEMIQAISKASSDLFMRFATSFLPFAFIGRNDLDDDAKERFDSAWKDNVGGSRALHLYLTEIAGLISQHIGSSLWPIRHACCFAVADLVSSMETGSIYNKEDALLIWPLLEEALNGKTWEGKEKVVQAFPKFVMRSKPIWADITAQMKKIVLREAKRQNKEYRPYALRALGEFARIRQDVDLGAEVSLFAVEIVSTTIEPSDEMDIDVPKGSKGIRSR